MELLACKICGEQYANLVGHLRKHQITPAEYKQKFGVDRVVTREHAQLMAKRSNEKWSEPETRKNRSEGIRKSYNAKLRTTRRNSALEQFRDPAQRIVRSILHKGKTITQETRAKISKSNTTNSWTRIRQILYERSGGRCETCNISEKELISQAKRRLVIHEKKYTLKPKAEDCILCCSSCHRKEHNRLRKSQTPQENSIQSISRNVMELLKTLKLDLLDDNFLETPRRFGSVLAEFSGVGIDFDYELEEIRNSIFDHSGEGIIAESKVRAYGLCPHHLLPVQYDISLAYLPKGYAIGVSKLNRLCDLLAKELQLQEHYTRGIADSLTFYLKTPDVAVITSGIHMCMRMRGIEDQSSTILVSEMRGAFRENQTLRMELLALLGLSR